ncbi:aldehyde dehydrogenase [bacterium]|nr:aldehyde dehydrogenase [bacterium]
MDLHFLSDMGISHSQIRTEARLAIPPLTIGNWIDGEECYASSNRRFLKLNPRDGGLLAQVTRSAAEDVNFAVIAASRAARAWDARGLDSRADYLLSFQEAIEECFSVIAQVLALETARSERDAEAEVQAALDLATVILNESRALGNLQSLSSHNSQFELGYRTPQGVAAAIHSGALPFLHFMRAAYAALINGNTFVWKPSKAVPCLAAALSEITKECCFPDGVFNVVYGSGEETAQALVSHPSVDLIDFVGSPQAFRQIESACSNRSLLVKTISNSIPVIVCEDANLKTAARTTARSVFDKESKFHDVRDVFVHESVYDSFRDLLMRESYRYQPAPLLTERKLLRLLKSINQLGSGKATVLSGGYRLMDESRKSGNYLAPTVIEVREKMGKDLPDVSAPLACLHSVRHIADAVKMIGKDTQLPSILIHTRNHDLAREILYSSKAASVVINGCAERYALPFNDEYFNRFSIYTSVIRTNGDDDSHSDIR